MYIVIYLYISLYANIIKFGLLSFANNQRKEQKYSQKQDKDHRYGIFFQCPATIYNHEKEDQCHIENKCLVRYIRDPWTGQFIVGGSKG